MRRRTFAAIIAVASGSSLLCHGAAAQWWDLPDGIDNPRPRYYDYHPPGVFYADPGPVGFAVSGYVAPPSAASPTIGGAGYGYGAPPSAASPTIGGAGYGYGAPPSAASPAIGGAGYGYGAPPYPTAGVVVPIAPRPLCGVYRYWRDGVCLDRRGY